MSECDFVRSVYAILGIRWPSTSMDEAIRTLEETQSIAATGNLPERWTIFPEKKNEAPVRNVQ